MGKMVCRVYGGVFDGVLCPPIPSHLVEVVCCIIL